MSWFLDMIMKEPSVNDLPKVKKPTTVGNMKAFPILSDEERAAILDRDNKDCPFNKIIGQDNAIDAIFDLLDDALRCKHHLFKHAAILLYGGHSNGKTTFSRLIAETVDRPIIETDGNTLKSADVIFELIEGGSEGAGLPLKEKGMQNGRPFYEAGNIVFFIDEIHAMGNNATVALLKALESNDRTLLSSKGYIDCRNVLFIGATTERGDIFLPLESRFFGIKMLNYTLDEVAEIVNINHPKWRADACKALAVRGGRVVRNTLQLADAVYLNFKRKRCKVLTNGE